MNYDPLNETQIAEINSQVRRYLEGAIDEIDVSSRHGLIQLVQLVTFAWLPATFGRNEAT